ncbi:YesL family protein [Salisediminibacterium selenitireducens]|uniref:Integral membrane protein n=1 Tax=Bacillus selenitireducens (strain ATCC 700615 / DSM 15326 / MLS10) TaxID=439292 RepID=D6XWN6_BACIE|nr:DUF624 domain-containing protein [Salisediminibacterium selenitireducens]ADH97878.1 protein of unknown function DUF624 [[Bacillus] selenitireducens MLS10]
MTVKLDAFFRLITRFSLLNVNWIAGIVAGLLVLGLFPATVATFIITRRWIREGESFSVTKAYWQAYKQVFVKANLFGIGLSAIGLLLYVNYRVIQTGGIEIPLVVTVSFITIVFLYLLFAAAVIPVSIHFTGTPLKLIQKTIWFIFAKPHLAVLLVLLMWGIAHVSLLVPAAILFFTGSVGAYTVMWIFLSSLDKISGIEEVQSETDQPETLSLSNRRILT